MTSGYCHPRNRYTHGAFVWRCCVSGKRQVKRSSFGDSHRAHPPKSVRKLVPPDSTVCNAETHYPFDLFGVTRMVLVFALSSLRTQYYHADFRLRCTRLYIQKTHFPRLLTLAGLETKTARWGNSYIVGCNCISNPKLHSLRTLGPISGGPQFVSITSFERD